MTFSVEERVRNANLVEGDDHLSALYGAELEERLLLEIRTKAEGGTTAGRANWQPAITRPARDTSGPMRSRARWGVAAASLAGVALLGIVVALVSRGDPVAEAVSIAEVYEQAIGVYDEGTIRTLIAEDLEDVDGFGNPLEELDGGAAWYEAIGWSERLIGCQSIEPGPPTEVECTYVFENDWSRAVNGGPYTGRRVFSIEHGKVINVTNSFDPQPSFYAEAWQPFVAWVGANHHPDHQSITKNAFQTPVWTPEALALWEQYTDEYVAEQQATD